MAFKIPFKHFHSARKIHAGAFAINLFILLCSSCTNNSINEIETIIPDSTITISETKPDSTNFIFVDTSFENFYTKFISDSVFQISNVRFPVQGNYSDYDATINWGKTTWPFMSWDFRTYLSYPVDSSSVVQNERNFFFGHYCLDCGFSIEMGFEKKDGNWKMTRRQENNY